MLYYIMPIEEQKETVEKIKKAIQNNRPCKMRKNARALKTTNQERYIDLLAPGGVWYKRIFDNGGFELIKSYLDVAVNSKQVMPEYQDNHFSLINQLIQDQHKEALVYFINNANLSLSSISNKRAKQYTALLDNEWDDLAYYFANKAYNDNANSHNVLRHLVRKGFRDNKHSFLMRMANDDEYYLSRLDAKKIFKVIMDTTASTEKATKSIQIFFDYFIDESNKIGSFVKSEIEQKLSYFNKNKNQFSAIINGLAGRNRDDDKHTHTILKDIVKYGYEDLVSNFVSKNIDDHFIFNSGTDIIEPLMREAVAHKRFDCAKQIARLADDWNFLLKAAIKFGAKPLYQPAIDKVDKQKSISSIEGKKVLVVYVELAKRYHRKHFVKMMLDYAKPLSDQTIEALKKTVNTLDITLSDAQQAQLAGQQI